MATYPNMPDKHREPALIRPEAYLAYIREIGLYPETPVPEAVIFCFSRRLREYVEARGPGRNGDRYLSFLWIPDEGGGRVGIAQGRGIGGPATA